MRRFLMLAVLVACGGEAAAGGGEAPELGWCCEGLCGLWASEAVVFQVCTCDGAETLQGPAGRGECVPVLD